MAFNERPKVTFQEVLAKLKLDRTTTKGNIIFRPTDNGAGWLELEQKLVLDAFEEMITKGRMIDAGMDEPSACDKLLTYMFINHFWNG